MSTPISMRLKAFLIILLIVVSVAAVGFSASIYFASASLEKTMAKEQMLNRDLADKLVSAEIAHLERCVAFAAAQYSSAPAGADVAERMQALLDAFPAFTAFTLLDHSGRLASWGGAPASYDYLADSACFAAALGGDSALSSTLTEPDTGATVFYFCAPAGEGKVLAATLPGLYFAEILGQFRLWDTGNIYLADSDGTMIAYYDYDRVVNRVNYIELAKADPDYRSAGDYFRQMLLSAEGTGSYTLYGQERICAYRHISATAADWIIAVVAPLNESPRAGVTSGLITSAMLFMGVGAVVSVFLSGFAAKPFNTIREQATRIQGEHERIRLLLDATPLSCHLWNSDFQVFVCNEETVRLFNLRDKQQFLDDFFALTPEYQPNGQLSTEFARACVQKAFDEGRYVFECMHQTIDGVPIPAEVTLVRVEYEGGYAVAGYAKDLREHRKNMEEIEKRDLLLAEALKSARDANDAKSDFLAKMSHEMRTPLNVVIGLSGLSLESGQTDAETRSNLEKIYDSGSILLSTVNDILDISKIEAGKMELTPVDYDVPSLINDTITQNILRINEKPVTFSLDIEPHLYVRLHGDELRVKQVVNNLLSNAIKYTHEGEVELRLRCVRDGDLVWLTICVRDTGIGIRPEEIDRLFTNYVQLDTQANHRIEGTGLGLPITKKLAELMDGSVNVESRYGQGSIFTVTLRQGFVTDDRINPEVVESLMQFRYADDKRSRSTNLNRVKLPDANVLVVDDNVTNLDVAKGLMKPYGMRIDCVTGGQEAIKAVRDEETRYDAIFMDHMMPGMDGIEATRQIREIDTDYARTVPIIALTANATVGNEEMFLSHGFQAFLSKPIDILRLDKVIRQWIRDHGATPSPDAGEPTGGSADGGAGRLTDSRTDGSAGGPTGGPADGSAGAAATRSASGPERRSLTTRRSGLDRRVAHQRFAGLDMEKGIERFGGDEEVYRQVLRSYCTNTAPLLESAEGVEESGLAGYAILLHGIKGSSRGIYADMIGDAAEKLEHAAEAGDFTYVSAHNATFVKATRKLIRDLEEKLGEAEAQKPKPVQDQPDVDTLRKLLVACRSYDMDGVDTAMDLLERYAYTSGGELVPWLHDNITLMNFRDIIEKLTALTGDDAV